MAENCKYYKEKRQVSYDNGATYVDVVPAEYRKGGLIEAYSYDCGGGSSGYSGNYLTFVAIESGTFRFNGSSSSNVNNSSIQYSLDNGSTWYTLNRNVNSPTVSAGYRIMWKSTNLTPVDYNNGTVGIGYFKSTGKYNVEGNIMSLFYGDNFENQTSLSGKKNAFYGLFQENYVVNANNLILPATTLADSCYQSMFSSCELLTSAPELPATTLAKNCYANMFQTCSSLATLPDLPATTLAENCYSYMFGDCDSIVTVPSNYLSATTLANACYSHMFGSCSSLTTAPSLPVATLVQGCYQYMFDGCTSLSAVTCLATDISATTCTYYWLNGVSSTGTFTKAASMDDWTEGASGIPSNWTVQDA